MKNKYKILLIIIICLIASILSLYIDNPLVIHALAGIRIGVCALICVLVFDMAKKIYKQSANKKLHFVIFFISLFALLFTNISAVLTVIAATVIGFVPAIVARRKK